jgi:hypothetical protein
MGKRDAMNTPLLLLAAMRWYTATKGMISVPGICKPTPPNSRYQLFKEISHAIVH